MSRWDDWIASNGGFGNAVSNTLGNAAGYVGAGAALGSRVFDFINSGSNPGTTTSATVRDVNTNGFLASKSIYRPKYFVRAFDEPTYLTFKLEFMFNNNRNALYNNNIINQPDNVFGSSEKEEGYDLVVSKRVGIHLQESFFRRLLRKIIIKYIEFITGEKVKDINSGFRVFDKSTVTPFFPQLCNTFSFTTTQTLAYIMNSYRVGYVDIKYHERIGKSKVKFFKDSFIMLRYILEACVYYNPLKVFGLFIIICFLLSLVCFILSYSMNLFVFYILGIVNLILTVLVFGIGLLGVFLKQMNIQK